MQLNRNCLSMRASGYVYRMEFVKTRWSCSCALGPAYNEFGYNEHPAITSRFLSIKIIDRNVKNVWLQRTLTYNKQFLLHLFTRCKWDPSVIVTQTVHKTLPGSLFTFLKIGLGQLFSVRSLPNSQE